MHTKKTAPKIANSALRKDDLGAANTVNTIDVPGGAVRVRLWFTNSGNTAKVRGRVGFAGEAGTPTAADTDNSLGHVDEAAVEFELPSWARVLHVASSTANADVLGTWFYD